MVGSKGSVVAFLFAVFALFVSNAPEVSAQLVPSWVTLRCQYTYRTAAHNHGGKPIGREAKACHFQVLLGKTTDQGNELATFDISTDSSTNGVLFQGTYQDLIARLSTGYQSAQAQSFAQGYFVAALPVYAMAFGHSNGACVKAKEELQTSILQTGGANVFSYLDRSSFACGNPLDYTG